MPFVLKEMKMILNGEACALCRVVSLGSLLPIIGGRSNEIVAIASDDRLRVPMRWHPLRPRRGSMSLILTLILSGVESENQYDLSSQN